MEVNMLNIGLTDLATSEDWLGMSEKYDGLAEFIKNCRTPITIAIQGDWGVGKTSAMKYVKKKIEESNTTPCIWFKTWQFSTLKENDDIFLSFLLELYCKLFEQVNLLIKADSAGFKRKKIDAISYDLAKGLEVLALAGENTFDAISAILNNPSISFIAHAVSESTKWLATKIEKSSEHKKATKDVAFIPAEGRIGMPNILVSVCQKMNEAIDKLLELKGVTNNRICIFIDDLDRLHPKTALELLEGIKNFVEYEKCVFVLAIDKAVISQGLQSKYSKEFLEQKVGQRSREDNFFDKIIQIPFTLPEKSYDLSTYIKHLLYSDCLSSVNIRETALKNENKPTSRDYQILLESLEIFNPRSIKRYFNLSALYSYMSKAKDPNISTLDDPEWYDFCFFAIIILQIERKNIYNKFLEIAMTNTEPNETWNEIESYVKNSNDKYSAIIFSVFSEAKLKSTLKECNPNWFIEILKISDYNEEFNESTIYIRRLHQIVGLIKANTKRRFDFSEYDNNIKTINKAITKHYIPNIKILGNGAFIEISWFSNKRPCMVLTYKTDAQLFFSNEEFFCEYKHQNEMDITKNYYQYIPGDSTFKLYIGGSKKAYNKVIALLKAINYLPKDNS